MKNQLETAFNLLSEKLQGWLNTFIEILPNLAIAITVLFASYFTAKYVNKLVIKLVSKKVEQKSITNIVARIATVIVVSTGIFVALGILNLSKTLTTLITGAGVIGLVVGLALQGTLSNTIAGIILSFRKKIQTGNWVETNGFSGEVMDINLKGFVIKEADNNLVIIPNKDILEKPLKNYSLTTRMRVMLECGVGYESDLDLVEALTKQTIANTFSQVKEANEVEFYYTEFGGSSINYLCRFWIDSENALERLKSKSKAIIEIKKAYDKENINIPFPIRTLQFDNKLSFENSNAHQEEFSKN
ncbi:mechanosensitive ion channel family protein [Lacinutrix himadriensis]|uniref:mechanosensitive ion channel family protein n=1 Tax=Lacinutrix himadriensis TaxID=641549 RepID=UPI0006E2A42C|nr:mechanosensitive ion channel family protein [Lacinutrix himadriensis]